jgi:hypothetical protein
MNVGPIEAIVIFGMVTVGIAAFAVSIWAIVDAATQPDPAWQAIGSSKALWIALIAVFTFACGIVGFVLAIVYLTSLRPRLRAVATT